MVRLSMRLLCALVCVATVTLADAQDKATFGGDEPFLGTPPVLNESEADSSEAGSLDQASGYDRRAVGIDNFDKVAVTEFFNSEFDGSATSSSGWNGDASTCTAGSTTSSFKNKVLKRVNMYRKMCGLPSVAFDASFHSGCQQHALLTSASGTLTHGPTSSMACYTSAAANCAANANIAIGTRGADSVDAYIYDFGAGNTAVGHRRWLLFPRLGNIATGDVDADGSYLNANSIRVFTGSTLSTAPASPEYVAWPSPGFFPLDIYRDGMRWSLSLKGADFSSAQVAVKLNKKAVSTNIVHRNGNYGDKALVWEVNADLPSSPSDRFLDVLFQVTISNIANAPSSTISYSVTVFDNRPYGTPCDELTIQGVTGFNSGVMNGVFSKRSSSYNGFPTYTDGSYFIAYVSGAWRFYPGSGIGGGYFGYFLPSDTRSAADGHSFYVYDGASGFTPRTGSITCSTTTDSCTIYPTMPKTKCKTLCNKRAQSFSFISSYQSCKNTCRCGCDLEYTIRPKKSKCKNYCRNNGLAFKSFGKVEACKNVCQCKST
eukprot:m.35130 g.35130  ORF g.35130 m.35130 type:complete len:544 (+) comp9850_c0_seq1:78-1709(+)